MKAFVTLIVAVGLVCAACNKKQETSSQEGDKIGVQECDDYLAKFEACMKDVPEQGRPAMEEVMKQNRDAWKEMAKDSATRAGLKTSCQTALDALAQNPACK